jgi:hypothetical protein
MKTVFSHIVITYSEYKYYSDLDVNDQLFFLFDAYEAECVKSNGIDLAGFFEGVKQSLIEKTTQPEIFENFDYSEDNQEVDRVDVMIDEQNIMIESNSLKALRFVSYKFVECGYILRRDLAVEKMFRKDKVTRYLRVFKIINQATDLCFN